MESYATCAIDGPIRVGVSSCLLGNQVRFDGGHKRNDFILNTLGQFVELVPVCPEVEIGLGTPRETLRLVRNGEEIRLVGNDSETDRSSKMKSYAAKRVAGLARDDLSGYVLKKDS